MQTHRRAGNGATYKPPRPSGTPPFNKGGVGQQHQSPLVEGGGADLESLREEILVLETQIQELQQTISVLNNQLEPIVPWLPEGFYSSDLWVPRAYRLFTEDQWTVIE